MDGLVVVAKLRMECYAADHMREVFRLERDHSTFSVGPSWPSER